jgi:hypothetical protein
MILRALVPETISFVQAKHLLCKLQEANKFSIDFYRILPVQATHNIVQQYSNQIFWSMALSGPPATILYGK